MVPDWLPLCVEYSTETMTPACDSVVVQFLKESCPMNVQIMNKTVVSVAEMSRMTGLGRARFYQLMNEGVFPSPLYDVATRRPFFNEEMQAICMEVRRRNCGVNGKPILFADLLAGLRSLGLEITAAQVEPVVKELFPTGIQNLDSGEVIRGVFLRLKRHNTTGSDGE